MSIRSSRACSQSTRPMKMWRLCVSIVSASAHSKATGASAMHGGATARAVAPPCIAEAPVAFECALAETIETQSRHIFIGRVLWLHAREDLIDIEHYRVRLQNFFPVARF